MSGYFESVRWNACEHRLDLGLYSHPKEFLGNGVRTHVNSKEKTCLPAKIFPEENRTLDAASSGTASPTHHQRTVQPPPPPLPRHILLLTLVFPLPLAFTLTTKDRRRSYTIRYFPSESDVRLSQFLYSMSNQQSE